MCLVNFLGWRSKTHHKGLAQPSVLLDHFWYQHSLFSSPVCFLKKIKIRIRMNKVPIIHFVFKTDRNKVLVWKEGASLKPAFKPQLVLVISKLQPVFIRGVRKLRAHHRLLSDGPNRLPTQIFQNHSLGSSLSTGFISFSGSKHTWKGKGGGLNKDPRGWTWSKGVQHPVPRVANQMPWRIL